MVEKSLPVLWDRQASDALSAICNHIRKESPVNAENVKVAVLTATRRLSQHPEFYPPDKFKANNPGNFRAFEVYSVRIAYTHSETEVRILRVRHVRQEPKFY